MINTVVMSKIFFESVPFETQFKYLNFNYLPAKVCVIQANTKINAATFIIFVLLTILCE